MKQRIAALLALSGSIALHLGGLHAFGAPDAPRIEGSGTEDVARLGNSFQDVAAGSLVPVTPEAVADPVAPVTAMPAASQPVAASAVVPATPVTAASPDPVAAERPAAEAVTAVTPAQTVAATEPEPTRPEPRPDPPAREPEAAPRGAQEAERRGQESGREAATATRADARTSEGQARAAGNAAASNYPGLVMRKLARTRRPTAGRRGTAIVGFEVTPNGGLAGARILRSSGFAEVDRAALEHVARAAPFPEPPPGAQRRFQVQYESRG